MSDFVVEEFLKGSLPQIVPVVPKLSDVELAEVRKAENDADNTRSTLITALDREQAKRDAAAEAEKAEEQKRKDAAAQQDGFVDAEAQAAAAKAAKKPGRAKKRASQPKALVAKVVDNGMEEARQLLSSGELEIGFGDNEKLNPDIPKVTGAMAAKGEKLNNQDLVVLRTAQLHRMTTVTYAYLIHGKRVLSARELGAPIRIEPGLQISFKPGTLSFS